MCRTRFAAISDSAAPARTPGAPARRPGRALLAAALATLAAAPLRADEVRLADGTLLYGPVHRNGDTLTIDTREGPVRVAAAQVQRVRTDAELSRELAALAARCGKLSAFSCLHLAHVARDWRLDEDMWRYLDQGIACQDSPPAVRARLDEFLHSLEPELLPARWRTASPATKAKEILMALRKGAGPSRMQAAVAVLSDLPSVDRELRLQARALPEEDPRWVANAALWQRHDEGNRRFLFRTTILDPSKDVRGRAIGLLRKADAGKEVVDYIAPLLVADHPKMRIRASEAMGDLGEPSALDLLVKAGPAAAGGSTGGVRAHVAFVTQQSYIRDFEVEVAQASFIADPQVDAITYGTVLDVRVGAVVTQRVEVVSAMRSAIAKLEGEDPGDNPATWEAWLAERRRPSR